jgi:dephospho-CoA kinase
MWANKYIVGLTGNIGTGKSVVRKMLEHLGAYGIDADVLAHRAIAKGSPGYQPVLERFGETVLGDGGEINRTKLAQIVFSDPEALSALENIVHPLVELAVDLLIRNTEKPIIVIEAIKLLESNLKQYCDSIWVTSTTPEVQLDRLTLKRKMTEGTASLRIAAQTPQDNKIAAADQIILNNGTLEETWGIVYSAWNNISTSAQKMDLQPFLKAAIDDSSFTIISGQPYHADQIASLFNKLRPDEPSVKKEDILTSFGNRNYMILVSEGDWVGAISWQMENLIAKTTEIIISAETSPTEALPPLIAEMEQSSKEHQCDSCLIYAPIEMAKLENLWISLGYQEATPQLLDTLKIHKITGESEESSETLFYKKLSLQE